MHVFIELLAPLYKHLRKTQVSKDDSSKLCLPNTDYVIYSHQQNIFRMTQVYTVECTIKILLEHTRMVQVLFFY